MPSQRFYRLPEEKQSLIWKASMKEFTSVPYEKVSINKIIREAGISRGSFYTYFEDKKDLLSFLLEDTKRKWKETYLGCLRKADGDVFSAMEEMLESAVEFCRHNNIFRLHKNLIMYPDHMIIECMEKDFEEEVGEDFVNLVDRSRLKDGSTGGVLLLLKMCVICMIACVAEYYKNPEKGEVIKAEYKKALRVLCYGAYRVPQKDQVEEKADE